MLTDGSSGMRSALKIVAKTSLKYQSCYWPTAVAVWLLENKFPSLPWHRVVSPLCWQCIEEGNGLITLLSTGNVFIFTL